MDWLGLNAIAFSSAYNDEQPPTVSEEDLPKKKSRCPNVLAQEANATLEDHERRLSEVEAILRALHPGKFPLKNGEDLSGNSGDDP